MERYEAYKDSGVEWIGEIPEGWAVWRLKHLLISEMQYGATESGVEYAEALPRYIRITDINQDGLLRDGDKKSLPLAIADPFVLEDGDLLFARSGATVGKTFLYRRTMGLAAFAGYLIRACTNRSLLMPEYLNYWTQTAGYDNWKLSIFSQATIQNIGADKYKELPVAYPDLASQQAIVDYLDAKTAEVDALVADCEREVGLLREYRKAVISEAVTKGLDPDVPMKDSGVEWIGEIPEEWEVVGFKTYLTGIIDYRGRTPKKVDDGVFLITGRNIKQGRVHYELSQEYMRPEDFDDIMSRGKLQIGNVLFTMEAPLGEVALIDRDDCAAAQRIVQLCCNEKELSGRFLVYWVMSDEFQSDLQTYATGSTASGIKASKLGMLRLVHPPIGEQHAIADYLDTKTAETDSLIEAKQQMAGKLREYRKSLISEAVTGKFKVPNLEKQSEGA